MLNPGIPDFLGIPGLALLFPLHSVFEILKTPSMHLPDKIILAGFMATGKTSVGRILAERLGYPFVDTDDLVEELAKKKIVKIFAEDGEVVFRRWEQQAIDLALSRDRVVLAVGGGAVCFKNNLQKLQRAGLVLLLTASVQTLLKRVWGQPGVRPLLNTPEPEAEVRSILAKRDPYYRKISWHLSTDNFSPEQLADQVIDQMPLRYGALQLDLGERSYPLYFQRGGLDALPLLLRQHCPSERVVLVTNDTVDPLYGKRLESALKKEFQVKKVVLPDGERFKTLKTVSGIYKELVEFKVDRKTPLLALGGGVLGDLVGFAAASYLRGIPFVQIPTTLLAQVDSSVGGKTGVDLPEGKNLVGAFYQPRFVLIDADCLATLPKRQLVCGMAEVIKYGAIFDRKLFGLLEKRMSEFLSHPDRSLEQVIRSCCEWKAWVVERDEYEVLGLRSLLNFGHTLGHAIESLTGYKKYTHGEAIAMGMVFAARRSQEKTDLPLQEVERLIHLLEATGLPVQWPSFSHKQWTEALVQDKKRVSGQVNFVYLKGIGKAVALPTPLVDLLKV